MSGCLVSSLDSVATYKIIPVLTEVLVTTGLKINTDARIVRVQKRHTPSGVCLFCTRDKQLSLFTYTFEWGAVFLYIHEAASGSISLHELLSYGIERLRTAAHSAVAVAVTGRFVSCHEK